ncbi:plasmid replication protein RepC [Halovulum sp. GXIMD14794]
MKHASQIEFGRPEEAVQASAEPCKWEILDALTEAAEPIGLTHRTLNVLRALMTFLPDRHISPDPVRATVFPSNRVLAERLNGMPESTLRRHLSQLVALGVVSRHDSPNRKRYARRTGQGVALAFGFDLSPLALNAAGIFSTALDCREKRARAMLLRDQVAELRQDLIERTAPGRHTELLEATRLLLRRKPDLDVLTSARQALAAELDLLPGATVPELRISHTQSCVSGGTDSQNERHIQTTKKTCSDSEDPADTATADTLQTAGKGQGPSLHEFVECCTETRSLFAERIGDWGSLISISDRAAPMLGIDWPVVAQARQVMGPQQAALAVLCILEKHSSIKTPGAYLRRLTQKAASGKFSIVPMMSSVMQCRKAGVVS